MLKSAYKLLGMAVATTDGKAGTVHDLLFNDQSWQVEQIVVDTGNIFPGRKVVIEPSFVDHLQSTDSQLQTQLSLDEIQHRPRVFPFNLEQPAAPTAVEQPELPLERLGGGLFQEQTVGMEPDSIFETIKAQEAKERAVATGSGKRPSHNYYSAKETIGAAVVASDGDLGHIEDLQLEAETWLVKQVVIDTRNWLPGRRVRVEPRWIDLIDPLRNKVYVRISQAELETLPEANLSD
ncbi:MAG TPA: PRC-barrel domain-containing protein [Anaerolineae bacterium]|nr:PRC-barrel domain-containing protein [Anaerolineae bacterium]HMR68259.1 PRC-barrel domain-containing protein [Anaerolineae bacterium]